MKLTVAILLLAAVAHATLEFDLHDDEGDVKQYHSTRVHNIEEFRREQRSYQGVCDIRGELPRALEVRRRFYDELNRILSGATRVDREIRTKVLAYTYPDFRFLVLSGPLSLNASTHDRFITRLNRIRSVNFAARQDNFGLIWSCPDDNTFTFEFTERILYYAGAMRSVFVKKYTTVRRMSRNESWLISEELIFIRRIGL